MQEPSEFNKTVTLLLDSMKPYFERHSHDQISFPQQLYTDVVRATIIKAYEFVISINQHQDDHMFFALPALRGICEEYIVEKFLHNSFPNDKDEITLLRYHYDHIRSCIAQWKYFELNRGDQRLYYQQDFPGQLETAKAKLRAAINSKLPGIIKSGQVFPSVHFMSKEVGEGELYNYLYHASSTFVHFSPNNLLRMGWGELPKVQYSTSNFKLYYKDFALFYGLLMLSKLCDWQDANGFLPAFNKEYIKLMEAILAKAERWPELVTFEEMNVGALSKNLFFKSPNELNPTN